MGKQNLHTLYGTTSSRTITEENLKICLVLRSTFLVLYSEQRSAYLMII